MTDTLSSICGQCTHLRNPQLDFIPSELQRHKQIILRDLSELISAASHELEKTVAILAGSILEALLFGFLKGQESFITARLGKKFILNPKKDGLQKFVNVFNCHFRDRFPIGRLTDIVVRYRDLIHFNCEVSSSPEICQEASRFMLRILNTLLGQLAQAGR